VLSGLLLATHAEQPRWLSLVPPHWKGLLIRKNYFLVFFVMRVTYPVGGFGILIRAGKLIELQN
jgi:hypothetical protein